MITKEEKRLSVEHYNRMIDFVEKQPANYEPGMYELEDDLKETYNGNYCILCFTYYAMDAEIAGLGHYCDSCPLFQKTGLACEDIDSLWYDMFTTYFDKRRWLKAAKKMRDVIQSLEEEPCS